MISLRDVVTGFGNRDPLAEVWRRNLRGGGGGSAEITGVPPLRYIGDGRPLTDYTIAGNAIQDGTPSADAPVDAVGSGVRSANLAFAGWAEDFVARVAASTAYITQVDGRTCLYANAAAGYPAYDTKFLFKTDFKESTVYTLVFEYMRPSSLSISSTIQVRYTDGTAVATTRYFNDGNWHKYIYTTAPGKTVKDICCFYSSGHVYIDVNTFMVVEGSTSPQTYIPYGYNLPLTVNGTEYPIYLGTVPTTRRIKKLVLTGEEDIVKSGSVSSCFYIPVSDYLYTRKIIAMCSHYEVQTNINGGAEMMDKHLSFYANQITASHLLYIRDTDYSSTADFKSYLAQQYANGTPVTVWYVLAEPETAVVNEPLMKIGDYADTISFEQSGVTIPTVNGENVFDVPTTVPPSEVTIKGGIRSV